MKLANQAIAKTVMRKKNFHTSSPKLALENGWDGAASKHPGTWDSKPSEKFNVVWKQLIEKKQIKRSNYILEKWYAVDNLKQLKVINN